eukprot:COSAG03_NODE_1063_length_4926_cov_40.714108_4_plen_72_part_00
MMFLYGGSVCENMRKRSLRDSNPRALAVWYGALRRVSARRLHPPSEDSAARVDGRAGATTGACCGAARVCG